jgi:undecaprenyl-diphosphatase
MALWQIAILAIIQGLAELLPVSSSAHVVAVGKLMGFNPSAPQFTMLLVMLHTGTMLAVIVHFWKAWMRAYFSAADRFVTFAIQIIVATAATGVIALALKFAIEHFIRHLHPEIQKAEVEDLFQHLELLAAALAAVGVLILIAGLKSRRHGTRHVITVIDSLVIGAIQGLCLPFRGFSRSGATISVGMLRGIDKMRNEEFSFALAVVLTPAVILLEARRLMHDKTAVTTGGLHGFAPSLIGMVLSFAAGLVALRLLTRLLEKGQWWVFGVYCLIASAGIFAMYLAGY